MYYAFSVCKQGRMEGFEKIDWHSHRDKDDIITILTCIHTKVCLTNVEQHRKPRGRSNGVCILIMIVNVYQPYAHKP